MSEFVQRGKGDNPTPLTPDDSIVMLATCPSCKGRGWFLINPFATGGSNGAGGLGNMTQCLTCLDAREYCKTHGRLPDGIVDPRGVKAI
jgi:hypothetical protein